VSRRPCRQAQAPRSGPRDGPLRGGLVDRRRHTDGTEMDSTSDVSAEQSSPAARRHLCQDHQLDWIWRPDGTIRRQTAPRRAACGVCHWKEAAETSQDAWMMMMLWTMARRRQGRWGWVEAQSGEDAVVLKCVII
jgi:hypothetical protein